MKIKDLPKNTNMGSIKVRVPANIDCEVREGFWHSQWGYPEGKAGVWLKSDINSSRIYPVCIDSLEQCLEWDVL